MLNEKFELNTKIVNIMMCYRWIDKLKKFLHET